MSIGPDSGDSEILQHTTRDPETGAFTLTLPDGEILQGGPFAGQPSFADVSSWCEGIRSELRGRIERADAERRARKARPAMDEGPDPAVPVPQSAGGGGDDPQEWAEKQVHRWEEILHNLKDQAEELSAKMTEANENYTKWSRILRALEEADG